MYKAAIEVTEFSRSGWDEYTYVNHIYIEGDDLETVKRDAELKVKAINNESDSKGDFGITLSRKTATLMWIAKDVA